MKKYKKYIDVVVHINKVGAIKPLFIIFDDEKYAIDRILQIKKAASPLGGSGILYECKIQNSVRHLFLEKDRWFIESYHA